VTHQLISAALLSLVLSAGALRGDDAEKDLDQLQGAWDVTAMEAEGKPVPLEAMKEIVMFKGEVMVVNGPGFKATEHRIKLDPAQKPKTLDATPTSDGKGRLSLGIYQLNGDEMKLCLPIGLRTERPTEFKSAEGSNLVVMTLKRSKK
jgi:uncharacterized protein (TIGR03067 family)